MEYRRLGRTGLDVSAVGFGASPLGNVFGDVSPEAADRAVRSAVDHGINLFDVSPYYGLTLAEERLGSALEGRRGEVILGTKCGRYGADYFDFSAATVTREFEQSLRRLRTETVDLLQAHDIEFGDLQKVVDETIPAMRRLQEQGKVHYIGITSYWPDLLARVAAQTGVDCVLNYCHANLFVDDLRRTLRPVSMQEGFGVLNASPLHMGLLGDKPVPAWHPAPVAVQDAAAKVREICADAGADVAMLALRVCLDEPGVASTFVGISSEAEVRAAVAAVNGSAPPDVMEAVRAVIAPVHNTVWPSGRPENQDAASTGAVQRLTTTERENVAR